MNILQWSTDAKCPEPCRQEVTSSVLYFERTSLTTVQRIVFEVRNEDKNTHISTPYLWVLDKNKWSYSGYSGL